MAAQQPFFLRLPEDIRLKVYTYAGMVRPCPVVFSNSQTKLSDAILQHYMDLDGNEWGDCDPYRKLLSLHGTPLKQPDCFCPPFPKQLLRISKAVYQDLLPILYGQNRFVIRAHEPNDLSILHRFAPTAISALRCLMIRLNSWPCPRGHNEVNHVRDICLGCRSPVSSSDLALQSGVRDSKSMVQKWTKICNSITPHVTVGQLQFTLIADVGDFDMAEQVLEPLQKMPKLKDCAIRLCRRPDYELTSLAISTCANLTLRHQTPTTESGFPFHRLPKELRLQILSYTHLAPGNGFDPSYTTIPIEDNRLVQRKAPRSRVLQRMCCHKCTFTGRDCCCGFLYAASSGSCECRALPMALFLVDRQLNSEANEVLFSTNCFQFEQSFDKTLEFFRQISPAALGCIRQIKFAFEREQIKGWAYHKDSWTALLSFIRDNFNLSNLFVSLDTSCDAEECLWGDDAEEITRPVYDAYIDIAKSIKLLIPGILDFHVTLGWFLNLEPVMEKYIMGDTYDSVVGAKHSKEPRIRYRGVDRGWDLPTWHYDVMPM